jgi:hypothetical protein
MLKKFPIIEDEDRKRKYITIPFTDNGFFDVEITDIICGKEITQDQIKELNSIKNKKEQYKQVKLWSINSI